MISPKVSNEEADKIVSQKGYWQDWACLEHCPMGGACMRLDGAAPRVAGQHVQHSRAAAWDACLTAAGRPPPPCSSARVTARSK